MEEVADTARTLRSTVYGLFKRFISLEMLANETGLDENADTTSSELGDATLDEEDAIIDEEDATIDEEDSAVDEYLALSTLTLNSTSEQELYRYEPSFVSNAKMYIYSPNTSAWTRALKRRRLERNIRKDPFVRYDMNFVNDGLRDLSLWKSNEERLEEELSVADDLSSNTVSNTRSSSPCRSSSTLSSAYSSEEISSVSSASQYSCVFTSELSSPEEETLLDVSNDTIIIQPKAALCHDGRNGAFVVKPRARLPSSRGSDRDAAHIDEVRLRGHIERAFKYCKLFEILEQPCNRFRISPSSYGLGLPLTHLDRCWPPVAAAGGIPSEYYKEPRRRLSSFHSKKKKRYGRTDHSECTAKMPWQPDCELWRYDNSMRRSSQYQSPLPGYIGADDFHVSEMDILSEEIWAYHMSMSQSEEALNMKMQLRDVLYCALSQLFPMCGLYVVGSSLNGFGTNSSDMDLCLMISNKEINQRTDAVVVLDLVRNLFRNIGLIREQKLIIAKVPILRIKFHEPYASITVDLNANNSVAIRNTQLLCYYSYHDWRVRPLVSVVKEWAKQRDINDANRSSFTSYSLVLMVIHYLQCEAKILPSLQEKYPKIFNSRMDVRTLSVSLPLDQQNSCHQLPDKCGRDRPTLGELLLGFFEYYAQKFDYGNDAISIRLGQKTDRRFVASQQLPYSDKMTQWNCICIEEPFTYTNTAHSVHDQMVFDQIRLAFIEDHKKLEQTGDLRLILDINLHCGLDSGMQRSLVGSSETLVEDSAETSDISTCSGSVHCQVPSDNEKVNSITETNSNALLFEEQDTSRFNLLGDLY